MSIGGISRRDFLGLLGITGGGLVLPFSVHANSANGPKGNNAATTLQLHGALQVTADSHVVFYLPRTEMGQGVSTGLTTLVAEELNLSPEAITIRHAGVHQDFANSDNFGLQLTGASNSIKSSYLPLRKLGAQTARLLRQAAAQQLDVPFDSTALQDGMVVAGTGSWPIGEFVATALTLPVPEISDEELRPASEFRYIGKFNKRVDTLKKVTGQMEFGIDTQLPNCYRAVIKRCPVIGGSVKSYTAPTLESLPGVESILQVFSGVAVLADTYTNAKNAAEQIEVEWNLPKLAEHSSESIQQIFTQALDSSEGKRAATEGDGASALNSAAFVFEAEYRAPYLAHATMEPMNCAAQVRDGRCDIWAPNQAPDFVQQSVSEAIGIDRDDINVHTTNMGGGFGRRIYIDFAVEAAVIAKESGLPVQVIWSREQDMQHDYYRPAATARFKVGVDEAGKLHSWVVKRAGPNIMPYFMDQMMGNVLPKFLPSGAVDWVSKRGYGLYEKWVVDAFSIEGLWEDYDIPNKEVRHITVDPGLRVGFWRSVGHSYSGFFAEGMMDEIAVATGQDPLTFRLEHSQNNPRLNRVLERVGRESQWGTDPGAGNGRGVAAVKSFGSYVAQVAEVSVDNGVIDIRRIVCAVDCGRVVNPDIVVAQVESAVIYGLSAALYGDIAIERGAVQQSNFHDYPVLRMNETPEIEVHIIDSDESPTGIGEPGLPPVAPAVANAIFQATRQRLRQMPLSLNS